MTVRSTPAEVLTASDWFVHRACAPVQPVDGDHGIDRGDQWRRGRRGPAQTLQLAWLAQQPHQRVGHLGCVRGQHALDAVGEKTDSPLPR